MKKTFKKTVVLFFIVVGIAAGVGYKYTMAQQVQPAFITDVVKRGNIESVVLTNGVLYPSKLVSVGAQISGLIEKIDVQVGEEIKKGDLVAQIDNLTQQNALKEAEASLKSINAQYRAKQAQITTAMSEFTRKKKMLLVNAISQSEYDTAESILTVYRAELDQLSAEKEKSIISVDNAKLNLGYTSIASPIDGTVIYVSVEEGQTVNNNQGTPNIIELAQYLEALKMSLIAMSNNRLRTFLTMLGIIIGIASVVSVVALGAGSQQSIMDNIASMGTNTIEIKPGTGLGDRRSGRVRTLTADDANSLKTLPFVDSVTPTVRANVAIRYSNETVTGSVQGVGTEYFRVRGYSLAQGQYFGEDSIETLEQVAVIDANTKQELFSDGSALGSVIFLGRLLVRVIGVTEPIESVSNNSDELNIWLPYTTVSGRIFRQNYVDDITVRVDENVSSDVAEQGIISLLSMRHGLVDFYTINTDTVRKSIEKTSQTMTLLISAIAFISLLVGGIGVMNIMLVSVTERTREIGIRIAVGARQTDIMRQFLIEAVLVCFCGGALGVGLAYLVGVIFTYTSSDFQMIYSGSSIVAAFACSTLIGILFGYLPARNAAKLNPIDALSRD